MLHSDGVGGLLRSCYHGNARGLTPDNFVTEAFEFVYTTTLQCCIAPSPLASVVTVLSNTNEALHDVGRGVKVKHYVVLTQPHFAN